MGQSNPTSTNGSASRIMQPGLYIKGASLTILGLCWDNFIGFPWSIGSVAKFCSSPTRHWMAILNNISQRWYLNMYHHGPSVRRINISSIHQDGGLKHLESSFRQGSPDPMEPSTPSAWIKLHLLTLSRPDIKFTCSTKHFGSSLYV